MSFLENPSLIVPAAGTTKGRITLVGAGPGAADLLTLRAIRCLGQADVVFYDRLVDPEVLAFARNNAERVFVGKEVGAHSWPQARIDAAIVAAALAGRQVVRLKSGDPSIFGRAAEEIDAARAHGISVDIIPGVTAASAAAASLCQPLTERGVTDRVVLATATCRPGESMSDVADIARPGTTLVFYMAMKQLAQLSWQLVRAGVAPHQPVTIAASVSHHNAQSIQTTVEAMAADCAAAGLKNPSVILISLPKSTETAGSGEPRLCRNARAEGQKVSV
ncbi:MAG TPA: uroporphyrinogen-III C-methyltransferase [Paracoccaceae bacterium]|nr:uroporphyrinogen-III C-methyltransferase [Paracoccaceae bacterium]